MIMRIQGCLTVHHYQGVPTNYDRDCSFHLYVLIFTYPPYHISVMLKYSIHGDVKITLPMHYNIYMGQV